MRSSAPYSTWTCCGAGSGRIESQSIATVLHFACADKTPDPAETEGTRHNEHLLPDCMSCSAELWSLGRRGLARRVRFHGDGALPSRLP
jgi:hypothetical protein